MEIHQDDIFSSKNVGVVARSLFAIWVGLWCEIMMVIFKFGEVDVYKNPSMIFQGGLKVLLVLRG